MEHKSTEIQSEIGKLKTVLVHAPGIEATNYDFIDLERVFGRASFCLERAQAEHRAFVRLLQNSGVEVLYLEDLVAQTMTDHDIREAFIENYLAESGLHGVELLDAIKRRITAIENPLELVLTTMQGLHVRDVSIPQEHRGLCAALNAGSDKDMLLVDPMTDLFFTRDPATLFGSCVRVNRLFWKQRNREALYYHTLFSHHPRFRDTVIVNGHDSAYFAEGGDTMTLSPTSLLIRIGLRTHPAAADSIARAFLTRDGVGTDGRRAAYALRFPSDGSPDHLDCHLTQINEETFVCSKTIADQTEAFKLTWQSNSDGLHVDALDEGLSGILADALGIPAVRLIVCQANQDGGDELERGGASVLSLEPGKVCSFEQNDVINATLSAAGFDVLTFPSSELTRSFGGPHCLCLPLERESV